MPSDAWKAQNKEAILRALRLASLDRPDEHFTQEQLWEMLKAQLTPAQLAVLKAETQKFIKHKYPDQFKEET
jgi:hypothetical protein